MMSKDEAAIEREIKEKGLTAKRITPEMLDAEVVSEQFHVFEGSCLTVCCLTLQNGFTVTGESACASPENFNAEIGQKISKANARDKIWPLLGFRLRDELKSNRPVADPRKGGENAKKAGILCNERLFHRFLEQIKNTPNCDAEKAKQAIYQICEVDSRRLLDHEPFASDAFCQLVSEYERWKRD